jgi:hypothetical protein
LLLVTGYLLYHFSKSLREIFLSCSPSPKIGRRGWGMRALTISLTSFEKWY